MRFFGLYDNTYLITLYLYGYSYTIFIPMALLCASCSKTNQWIFLTYACVHASSFMILNYLKEMKNYLKSLMLAVMIVIIGVQIGILFMFRLFFFQPSKYEAYDDSKVDPFNKTSIGNFK